MERACWARDNRCKEHNFGVGIWKAGDVEREFRHESEEVIYVLSGSGILMMNEEKARIGQGMRVFVPSNALHQIINDEKELVILWAHCRPIAEQLDFSLLMA